MTPVISAPLTVNLPRMAANPVIAARGIKQPDVLNAGSMTLLDIAARANSGLEVSRSMLTQLTATPMAAATNPERSCTSRVLAAPVLDSRLPQPFGGRERMDQVAKARKKRGFRPGPFEDAVVFHTGAVESTTFYLFVQREILAARVLVVAATDEQDNVYQQQIIDTSFMMPPQTFPAKWITATGPWFDEAVHVAQHQQAFQQRGYVGVMVTLKGAAKADRIQIGLLPQKPEWHRKHMIRPFYVAAVEVLTSAVLIRRC
jgi:hypothetical protein